MIALITGATSGIGKSTAKKLAARKYNLIITGRRKERLVELSKKLKVEYSVDVLILNFDVRNNDEVVEHLSKLPGEWKNIDILINNAGLAAGLAPIQDGLISDWERMIDTNVKGLLYVTKIVSQIMISRKKGHIVNIGSIAGKEVYPNGNVYCGTKHAVDALTKGMRIDLVKYGIKVSSIDPGMVDTEFSLVRLGDEEKAAMVYEGLTPLYADDIADAIDFMVSRPAHVTINDMVIMPTAQASATVVDRK
ncbi:MAG: SDR family NAD(P)-dependent oxidoreductase [Bacteroidota bacterium]